MREALPNATTACLRQRTFKPFREFLRRFPQPKHQFEFRIKLFLHQTFGFVFFYKFTFINLLMTKRNETK